jgi:Asp-tRNA(Asn)/Glu-tRNA(Gln) amidotransferase C subunit
MSSQLARLRQTYEGAETSQLSPKEIETIIEHIATYTKKETPGFQILYPNHPMRTRIREKKSKQCR